MKILQEPLELISTHIFYYQSDFHTPRNQGNTNLFPNTRTPGIAFEVLWFDVLLGYMGRYVFFWLVDS